MAREKTTAHVEGDDSGYAAVTPAPDPPAPPEADDAVTVLLLCDHVYLPADLMADDWAAAQVTVRYDGKTADGKRTRVAVSPSLAAFLQEREQAEVL